MIPFAETITSKEELIKVAKIGYDNYTNRKVTKNDFLVYFGFTHGEAITKFYPDNNYQVLLDAGFNTGSEAYFSAGINAWKNLKDGSYIFPPLYCNDNLINLRPGDSDDVIFITSEDSLCFYVLSESKNSSGLRTISKDLLREFIKYEISNPESSAHDARIALSGKSYIDKYEYGYEGTLWRLAKLNKTVPNRKVEAFAHSVILPKSIDGPLQKIVYGAPGTGKSFGTDGEIKKIYPTKEAEKDKVFRTTFHPDSDYSTFVGCYKPMAIKKEDEVYGVQKLREMYSEFRTKYPSHNISRFVGLYYKSFLQLTNEEAFAVFKGFSADTTIDNILSNAIPQAEISGELMRDCSSTITYDFTPQSFTKAYIAAWKTLLKGEKKPVFLVIEEINRGNCAQIFGDLFQLLDRTDGFSTYSIKPDTDLGDYIKGEFAMEGLTSEKYDSVVQGEELILPNNLFIWATMNTSDQSLFPIDSAFKRRWEWEYVPIKYDNKEWKVELKDGSWCKWVDLQQTLNDLIYDATESEDKMLGDWFVRADANNKITEENLVGKIIFYLWNDVAKVDAGKLFDVEVEKRGRKRKVIFSDFYKVDGKTDTGIVKEWLTKIGITINAPVNEDADNPSTKDIKFSKPEYEGILTNIVDKCKEQGIEYRFFDAKSANSIDIKVGSYSFSKLMVSVSLNNTGVPNADVKLWIEATPNTVETRDKLIANGAEDFIVELANDNNLSWEQMAKDAPDTENKVRGWRLRDTTVTFEQTNATKEADKLFDLASRIRERFATVLD